MTLKRLLHLCISILRRLLDLKSYIQPLLKSLLWLLSKLRRTVNIGRGTLPSSELSSEGCKEISNSGSFLCASQQPPNTMEADGHGQPLEMSHIPSSASCSTQPNESHLPQPHDPSLSQIVALTPAVAPAVDRAQNLGLTRPHLCTEVENLLATAPSEYQRYDRNEVMEKVFANDSKSTFWIQPLTTSLSQPDLHSDWQAINHPEGALYFYRSTGQIQVLTDAYLHDEKHRLLIDSCTERILGYIMKYNISLGGNTVLVLDARASGKIGYYFVDHEKQTTFWLDPFHFLELDELPVEYYTDSHVSLQVLAQYWYHNNLFPNCSTISSDAIAKLKDMLIFAVGDVLTTRSSKVEYTSDDLMKMLDLLDKMGLKEDAKYQAGAVGTLSRLLWSFVNQRFYHLYGERAARLCSGQSIFAAKDVTLFFKLLSPIFLFAPHSYLAKLKNVGVDSVVNRRTWKEMLLEFTDERKDLNLLATVLLATNVSFLAIQSVDNTHTTVVHQASYISILSSLGSIILGLLFSRVQHTPTLDTNFLERRGLSSRLGFETLALMYSLPFALLVWGMVFFLLSFSCMCFTTNSVSTYILVSFAWMGFLITVVWGASTLFSTRSDYSYPWPIRVWLALGNMLRDFVGVPRQTDTERGNRQSNISDVL